MDTSDIVQRLRTNFIVADMTLTSLNKKADIDKTIRDAIEAAQDEAKEALRERSFVFGGERLLPNAAFMAMIKAVGPIRTRFNDLLSKLEPEQRGLFAIDMAYRPVEDPDGFGMLGEQPARLLRDHVNSRLVKQYKQSETDLAKRLNSRLGLFIERGTTYHTAQIEGSRAIFREVLLTNLKDAATLARWWADVFDTREALAWVESVRFTHNVLIEDLRNDTEVRGAAIESARAAHALVRRFLGVE